MLFKIPNIPTEPKFISKVQLPYFTANNYY